MKNGLNVTNDNTEWGEVGNGVVYIGVPPHMSMSALLRIFKVIPIFDPCLNVFVKRCFKLLFTQSLLRRLCL